MSTRIRTLSFFTYGIKALQFTRTYNDIGSIEHGIKGREWTFDGMALSAYRMQLVTIQWALACKANVLVGFRRHEKRFLQTLFGQPQNVCDEINSASGHWHCFAEAQQSKWVNWYLLFQWDCRRIKSIYLWNLPIQMKSGYFSYVTLEFGKIDLIWLTAFVSFISANHTIILRQHSHQAKHEPRNMVNLPHWFEQRFDFISKCHCHFELCAAVLLFCFRKKTLFIHYLRSV